MLVIVYRDFGATDKEYEHVTKVHHTETTGKLVIVHGHNEHEVKLNMILTDGDFFTVRGM